MRFAFFGDVVGRSGRDGLADHLPDLRRRLGLEFVIVNAENAAAGKAIDGLHQAAEWALLVFIGLHVASALAHVFIYRDRIMQRMLAG